MKTHNLIRWNVKRFFSQATAIVVDELAKYVAISLEGKQTSFGVGRLYFFRL